MKHLRWSDVESEELKPDLTRQIVVGEQLMLARVLLKKGCVVPEHSHANEQVGLLIDGGVTFRVADQSVDLVPGATWCIPAHQPHEVRTGPDGAVIVEAFAPPRDDWRSLEETTPAEPRWPR